MLDQSFSVNNFRKLYDIDRKNKGNIEIDFFPEAYSLRLEINRIKELLKIIIARYNYGKLNFDEFNKRKDKLNKIIEIRKEKYNHVVNEKIKEILIVVNAKGYSLPLAKLPNKVRGRDVFSIGNEIADIFVSRQIQYTLKSLFNTKVNNRDLIVGRICTLNNELSPKFIIRADVENFYESIDHKKLLDILHSSPKLSVAPKKVITQLIRKYKTITGSDSGLPRGVGLSAYLSEIYMNDVDEKIKSINDITYYGRYVDDIILIFSPVKKDNIPNYLSIIKGVMDNRGLVLNNKTTEIDLYNDNNKNFEYLGYKFVISSNSCIVKFSSNKIRKIRLRIDKAFLDYNSSFSKTPDRSKKLIMMRLKFLTGNTRLHNSKSKAFVGVYFSNRFITDTSDLNGLDHYLNSKLNLISDQKLKRKISKLSFKRGFEEQIFRNFTAKELGEISKGWKNV